MVVTGRSESWRVVPATVRIHQTHPLLTCQYLRLAPTTSVEGTGQATPQEELPLLDDYFSIIAVVQVHLAPANEAVGEVEAVGPPGPVPESFGWDV